ncbi:PqiC family protein [Aquincola sp. MAHUQ-54]|uniref:PqiC family protein n=1 Tax=Aquincola agrisoli TaxID=3119538 RepID=A0AAW9QEK5_9BURK
MNLPPLQRPPFRPPALPRRALLAPALLIALAGCASSPPPAWHSVLPPANAAAPVPASVSPGPSIAVGRISVPEAIDRPALVVATGSGLAVMDGQRWIEPVKAQLPRAVALLLAERLPGTAVSAWPAAVSGNPQWRLAADVQRFDLVRAPAGARLRVVWSLQSTAGEAAPAALRTFDTTVAANGAGSDDLVGAMRSAIAQWAAQVAASAAGRAE